MLKGINQSNREVLGISMGVLVTFMLLNRAKVWLHSWFQKAPAHHREICVKSLNVQQKVHMQNSVLMVDQEAESEQESVAR